MRTKSTFYLISVAFLSIIAVWLCYRGAAVALFGVRTTAECVRVEKRSGRRGRTYEVCTLRFNDKAGEQFHVSLMNESLKQGDTTSILYNQNDPRIAYFDYPLSIWMLPSVLAAMIIAGWRFSGRT